MQRMTPTSPTPCASDSARPARISEAEALEFYRSASIHELGRRAHAAMQQLHPESYRTYVVDRNINYANWCTAHCTFCNFKANPRHEDHDAGRGDAARGRENPKSKIQNPKSKTGYVLSFDAIGAKIQELIDIGGTQVLMQGGLVPPEILGFEWYLDLLRFIKKNYPGIHVHAFSPPEIFAFHRVFDMPIRDVLLRLRDAGLDTIPGGGAEILVDRVRDKISRGKTRTDEYLEVMRQAHLIGMRTSMTMMFGHIETLAERIEHLRRVRDLQDETGGFTAFICWTFQPEGTALGRTPMRPADCTDEPDGKHLVLAGAHEYLKTLSMARIFLDNVPNVQASWVTQGPKIGQLALFFGANDMGSVMMEENVVSAAGTIYSLSEQQIRRLITEAGFVPKKRNCYYELLE
jgi:cyclic dehypoxanthinyl futalosine synthase